MKKFIKTSIITALVFTTTITCAQTAGNIGKNTYQILGANTGAAFTAGDDPDYHNYSAYATSGPRVVTFAKYDKDSLFATEEQYNAKNELVKVLNYRIKYKDSNVEITMIEKSEGKLYTVKVKNLNNNDAMYKKWKFTTAASMDYSGGPIFLEILFNSKESAQKFYSGIKNGTPSESTTQNISKEQTGQVKAEAEQVKIKIKNNGTKVAEMWYVKSPTSKDLFSFRVQADQTNELIINVGCSLYYKDGNSKGALILTATKAMDGTIKIVQ